MPWDFLKVGKTNLYGDCRQVFGHRLMANYRKAYRMKGFRRKVTYQYHISVTTVSVN